MGRTGTIDSMQMLLIVILLLCGYFYLFQAVAKRASSRSSIPMLAVVLLVVYLLISLPLVLIIGQMGGMSFVFLALLILAAFFGVFAFFLFIVRHFRELNKTALVMFFLYLLMVSYVTVFSRTGHVQTDILLSFDSIEEAINRHSLEPLQHLWLNIVMFMPIGALFAAIHPRLARLSVVLPLGMLLTTIIETTQLLMRNGQCDLEDLAANTLGTCLGLLLFKLVKKMMPSNNR